MKTIKALNSYNIFVGKGTLTKLPQLINLNQYSNLFLIIDKGVNNYITGKIANFPYPCGKIIIESGEKFKTIDTVQRIWQALADSRCDRKSLVINMGGGVILDMGGFAASTFKRGLDFVQVPTTLLSQVDASIGGKTGINFAGVKNLIGTFQQPIGVVIDVDTLSTLSKRELISGFGEIIKHGAIADKKYFQFVTSKKPLEFTQEELIKIIEKSCQIKASIFAKDPKENNLRKLLNFGHTIGHAIESLSQQTEKPLLHGEAISIGMSMEGQLSKLLGLLSDKDYQVLEQALLNAGLPTKMPKLPAKKIMEKIQADKKNEKGKVNWTLLQSIGKAIYNKSVDEKIVRQVI